MPSTDVITLSLELSRQLKKAQAARSAGTQVNLLQLQGLFFIKETNGISMKDLAGLLKIGPSTATAFVDRLQRSGWVKRSSDKNNRKVVHLHLTKKGDIVLRAEFRERQKFLKSIFAVLSENERKSLSHILTKLLTAFEACH